MEEKDETEKKSKEPVYVEKPDKTIIRTKHPRIEITCKASAELQTRLNTPPSRSRDWDIIQIRVLDADCTRKQLEHALRMAYEWLKHQNRIPDEESENCQNSNNR